MVITSMLAPVCFTAKAAINDIVFIFMQANTKNKRTFAAKAVKNGF
jgi:hypothetical protein